MVEGIQYGGGISSVRWKIFGTDMSHHQYGGDASSVQWRACSMDLSHHQYRRRVCSTWLPKLLKGELVAVFICENNILQTI